MKLAHDKDSWQALLRIRLHLRFSYLASNFRTVFSTISFSNTTLLHFHFPSYKLKSNKDRNMHQIDVPRKSNRYKTEVNHLSNMNFHNT